MFTLNFFEEGLQPRDLGERIFDGEILVFRQVAPLRELLDIADVMVREAFGDDPPLAHVHYDFPEMALRAAGLQKTFKETASVRALFQATLEGLGVPPEESFWDKLHLRVLPSGPPSSRRPIRSLPPHRDTWGSNLMAQINWWAPIYSLTPDRGLALYPDYWDVSIANSSPQWDFNELLRRRAAGETYPQLPLPTEPIDRGNELRLAPEPGDMLCFSGAHLHATVPNETGETRFSLETRTVWEQDLKLGRGAANLDGGAPRYGDRWFTHMREGYTLDLDEMLARRAS
jgi:hypothetical protein